MTLEVRVMFADNFFYKNTMKYPSYKCLNSLGNGVIIKNFIVQFDWL